MQPISIFWFRRDLRLNDNAGLYHALRSGRPVLPVFIFDTTILEKLPSRHDKRVDFIHQTITNLAAQLQQLGSSLLVLHGEPLEIYRSLITGYTIAEVYTNHDYEPSAIARDEAVRGLLSAQGIALKTFKDQCIFETNEVLKDDGTPYTVFTPYSRKWKQKLNDFYTRSYPNNGYEQSFLKCAPFSIPSLAALGFESTGFVARPAMIDDALIAHYQQNRDFPAIAGTSRLSLHLRFGTVSIRVLVRKALALSDTWLNELIWRDFYMMILSHFPQVDGKAFKPQYDKVPWRNNETEFEAWCQGRTGFPIVDAGMRELNATGFMHNRVRMIVASFLVKDLLIDWRWGEAYFAEKLLDFDLSANNGGWQWAAGSGCDAAPYFRVFNPAEQTKKFDPKLEYIRHWIPELDSLNYPIPIVDHAQARLRALSVYKAALAER